MDVKVNLSLFSVFLTWTIKDTLGVTVNKTWAGLYSELWQFCCYFWIVSESIQNPAVLPFFFRFNWMENVNYVYKVD